MRVLDEMAPEQRRALLELPTLTLEQAAGVLGCGASTLRTSIRRGTVALEPIKLGTRVLVPGAQVRALLGVQER